MLQKPRYSDGDLTLIYFGGEECSSGFQRMSVINFECNQTAGECAWRQWRLCVGGLGSWKQRAGGVVRPSPADGAPQGPLCGSGQEDPPTHPANGGHTHPVFIFCLFWEWARHSPRWESLSVPRSALTGVWTEPEAWAAHHLLVGCHATTLLPGNEFLGEPFCSWLPCYRSWIPGIVRGHRASLSGVEGFPRGSDSKESAYDAGDLGLIP